MVVVEKEMSNVPSSPAAVPRPAPGHGIGGAHGARDSMSSDDLAIAAPLVAPLSAYLRGACALGARSRDASEVVRHTTLSSLE